MLQLQLKSVKSTVDALKLNLSYIAIKLYSLEISLSTLYSVFDAFNTVSSLNANLGLFSEVLKALSKTRELYERWRAGIEGGEYR